jgi:hypothetical protein
MQGTINATFERNGGESWGIDWKKKCKEQLAQHNGKMFHVSLLVIILLLAFYFCSYSEPRRINLMLK